MMTEELNFCSLFFLFASMREISTANLKKKKTASFNTILAAILSSLSQTISALISATPDRVCKALQTLRMNESDPRSDVHYLGSSENKA